MPPANRQAKRQHRARALLPLLLGVVSCAAPATTQMSNVAPAAQQAKRARVSKQHDTERPLDDLSAADRAQSLAKLNELCADTFCEGPFIYRFTDLICSFDDSTCMIAFNMVTDAPTRPGLQPAHIVDSTESSELAQLLEVVPPADCVRNDAGFDGDGPACTMIRAACVLTPVRRFDDFVKSNWDRLYNCVEAVAHTALPDAATSQGDP